MNWKDEVAVSVISETSRMSLLNNLNIASERDLLVEALTVKKHLTKRQAEIICNNQRRNVRVKIFIDTLTKKMTTSLFLDLLDALGNYEIGGNVELQKELLDAYTTNTTNQKRELTPEVTQWMNLKSATSEPSAANGVFDIEIVTAESIFVDDSASHTRTLSSDTVDFQEPCGDEETTSNTHQLILESEVICFCEDRISKGRPMIIATSGNDDVTDVSDGLVSSKIILYDLIDKKTVKKSPLFGHSGSILHFFTVEDGRYCLVSSKDSQESDSAIQISLWPTQTSEYVELDLDDIECKRIEHLSACVVISEERAVLLVISQESGKIKVYFICNDQIEAGGSTEVLIESVSGVKCINSKRHCVFWGGQELELFEVDPTTGLNPKATAEVGGEISCCEFIPCASGLLLAVCYMDPSPDSPHCSHSIDLWRVEDQRTKRVHKIALQMLNIRREIKMNMLFAEQTCHLTVSSDRQCMLISYNPDDKTLTEETCVDVAVTNSQDFLHVHQHKLLKSDDEYTVYFVRCDNNKVMSITSIALERSRNNNNMCS